MPFNVEVEDDFTWLVVVYVFCGHAPSSRGVVL